MFIHMTSQVNHEIIGNPNSSANDTAKIKMTPVTKIFSKLTLLSIDKE